MPAFETPLLPIDDVIELNRLFLTYLRDRPAEAREKLGLPPATADILSRASAGQIDLAASFPRALFRLRLPPPRPELVMEPTALMNGSGKQVLQLFLLHSARTLSRMSGYAARLLLRLGNEDVVRLRRAEVSELVAMSLEENMVQVVFEDLEWIWKELLTETRPEIRRRLLLIGFQPDIALKLQVGIA